MPNEEKQISDLTTGAITSDDDVFVMDTYEGVTVKIPYSVLKAAVADAITPSINSVSKHWFVGETDTGVVAEGQDGATGATGAQGADGYSISATSSVITGGHRVTILSTDPEASPETFDVMDGITTIQTTSTNITATLLATDWQGSAAPYTQTINIASMTADIVPEISVVLSDTVETGIEEMTQWSYVSKAVSGAGTITFKCYETQPTIDLNIVIKVV